MSFDYHEFTHPGFEHGEAMGHAITHLEALGVFFEAGAEPFIARQPTSLLWRLGLISTDTSPDWTELRLGRDELGVLELSETKRTFVEGVGGEILSGQKICISYGVSASRYEIVNGVKVVRSTKQGPELQSSVFARHFVVGAVRRVSIATAQKLRFASQ